MTRRGLVATTLLGAAALLLSACSSLPRALPPIAAAPIEFSGRLALRVESDGRAEGRSISALFELGGTPEAGRLDLSSPLGTLMGRARWTPAGVALATPQGESVWPDLDAMTRELLGESVPVAALFDWLRGRPWSGAASQSRPQGFVQLGWEVDLSRFDDALLLAQRQASPVATVRVKLDRPRAFRRVPIHSSPPASMALRALYDVAAPAKLNLFLHVVGRRPDGYHLLESIFVLIDWADTLHFERRDDGRLQRHDLGPALPADDLCLRAARALQQASGTALGVDLSIDKQVPWGAGMGGGSSDAASTLLALNRLWGLNWSRARLADIALPLGADVPFFIGGNNAFVTGVGEQLTPIALPRQWLSVVKPAASIETKAIFASELLVRDTKAGIVAGFPADTPAGVQRLPDATLGALLDGLGRNDLQPPAEAACSEVSQAIAVLQRCFGNARMTGSGSAVFARAGTSDSPVAAMPADLPSGWVGRMCRSLDVHPLHGWAAD